MGDMDSENSGSIQSSGTGGADDHEYDSHGGGAASGSLLFNPMSCFNINTMPMAACSSTPLQLYSFNNGSSSSSSFSPHHQIGTISNFFDHPPPTLPLTSFHNNNNNNNNNDNNNNQVDIGWPEKFGSIRQSISTDDTNCTEAPLGYSITNNNQQLQQNPNPNPSPSSLLPLPGQGQGQGQAQGPTVSLGSPRSSSALGSGRNPKKRSRASRRAPTTVLTTDTTNFRQMVQEFTGIPSPPFTAFSPRTRYDLFTGLTHSNSSTTTMAAPSYLLRPFAQKISPLQQSLQFSTHNSNPLSDVLGLGTVTAATPSASHTAAPAPAPAPSTNFELCDAQNYLTTNPQLSFQSLLQPSSSHPTAQNSSSVNPTAGNYLAITSIPDSVAANGVSDNINGGSTKGEGMVDSWICASD